MQIYSKNNKNCFISLISWPIFILFVLSDRARWRLQNLYTKFWNSLIMLIYANLRSPGRDPGVQSAFFFHVFFFFFLLLLFYLFIFMSLPGASYLYFSHSNFFIFSPFPGHQMFIFWPVENCTTWNLRYLMLRDAGWALRHWRSCCNCQWYSIPEIGGAGGYIINFWISYSRDRGVQVMGNEHRYPLVLWEWAQWGVRGRRSKCRTFIIQGKLTLNNIRWEWHHEHKHTDI